jgi:dolichol-phosphate mannosyltransferase
LPLAAASPLAWSAALLAALQGAALARVTVRLLPGRHRLPPVAPRPHGRRDTTVTVIVATLNEARRIGPCLAGLEAQGAPLVEVLVVDSRSTDGTRELVEAVARRDPRFRLLTDAPRPPGWMGKVWALETGLRHARGEWVLGIDADTEPVPGLVAATVGAARRHRYDVVSFAPCFADQTAGERWLQAAMLTTLVYRVGAAGDSDADPERVMANGQCFLARRAVLEREGGYAPARASWCDDVTLARHLARRGHRVGFLDGARLYRVRSYASAAEAWREWGRSFDLSDASAPWRQYLDCATVTLAQGLPLLVLAALAVLHLTHGADVGAALRSLASPAPSALGLLALGNLVLLGIRLGLLAAIRGSYARRGLPFWLSPTADPLAVARLWLSTVRRPRAWRGRRYDLLGATTTE